MLRCWALCVVAAGLAACVCVEPSRAEEPAPTQFWLRADVPPQPQGKSPGIVLKRGDAVTAIGKIKCEVGGVTEIRFGPENKLQARVPTWLLSTSKPPPLSEPRGAAKKSQGDLERLKGAWGVVARSVLGTWNPAPSDKLNAHSAAEYWFSRKAAGLGGGKVTIRGFDASDAGALQIGFEFDGCIFTGKETALWRLAASDCDRPLEQSQNYAGTYEFRVDAATTPKRLDFLPRIRATHDVLAIYEFDGDFLKIAIGPSWVVKHPNWPPDPTKEPWRRPASFDAESTRQAIVLWLGRVDGREFPAPPGSLAGMLTLLTSPGVETSDGLSEPMKKLLGTWHEVVHEQGGSRDYAGLTWSFAPGRVTTWYPELPDRDESYAVCPEPGFIVDPAKSPPRLDLIYREPVTKTTWIQPGIYAWDGDRLKWCLSRLSTIIEGQSLESIDRLRPPKFETAAEGPLEYQTLVILERTKQPLEVPTRRPAVSRAEALRPQRYREAVAARAKALEAERSREEQERKLKFANETDRLLGTWRVVSSEIDGDKNAIESSTDYWNFSRERAVYWHTDEPDSDGFGADKSARNDQAAKAGLFGPAPEEAYSAGKFVIDDKAQPKRLDLVWGVGDDAFVRPGIYRWDGLRLVWCLECMDGPAAQELDVKDVDARDEQPAEKRRPTDFKTAKTGPAAYRELLVLRRVMEPMKVPEVKASK